MKTLVINLDRSTERLDFQRSQLSRLGLEMQRVEAVSAADASAMRPEAYWQSWERPLGPAERACLLSHISVWKLISESGAPALVLEDDAVLSRRVPDLLAALDRTSGIDHVTLEVRGRRKLLGRESRSVAGVNLLRLYQDRTGAAAYVLWPSGASKLIARAERGAALADAMICRAYELSSWQVEPACAIQLDICERYGVAAPLETRSTITGTAGQKPQSSAAQKSRRIAAQLRMGWRQLSHTGRAQRRDVTLHPADFS